MNEICFFSSVFCFKCFILTNCECIIFFLVINCLYALLNQPKCYHLLLQLICAANFAE